MGPEAGVRVTAEMAADAVAISSSESLSNFSASLASLGAALFDPLAHCGLDRLALLIAEDGAGVETQIRHRVALPGVERGELIDRLVDGVGVGLVGPPDPLEVHLDQLDLRPALDCAALRLVDQIFDLCDLFVADVRRLADFGVVKNTLGETVAAVTPAGVRRRGESHERCGAQHRGESQCESGVEAGFREHGWCLLHLCRNSVVAAVNWGNGDAMGRSSREGDVLSAAQSPLPKGIARVPAWSVAAGKTSDCSTESFALVQ
jgi:hypothetical protein